MRRQWRELNIRNKNHILTHGEGDLGLKFRMDLIRQVANNLKSMRDNIVSTTNNATMEHFMDTYISTYQSNINSFGLGAFFNVPDKRAIVEAINYPWSSVMWSERVWNNTDKITVQLQREITGALMRGDSYVNVAKRLDERLVKAGQKIKYVTERLVRTETARVRYTADSKFYKEIGLEKVEFCAIIDSKTSQVCRDYDGEIFDVGKEPSIPLHPHCRSTYLPVVPNVSQEEWLERIRQAKALDNPEPTPPPTPETPKKPRGRKPKAETTATEEKPKTKRTTKKKEEKDTPIKINEKGTTIAKNMGIRSKADLEKERAELQAVIDEKKVTPSRYSYFQKEIDKITEMLAKATDDKFYGDTGDSYYNFGFMKLHVREWREYTAVDGGNFFLNIKTKIPKGEEKEITEFLRGMIKERPDLHGVKISVDNGVVKKKGRGYTLGGYSPSQDSIRMGTFKRYKDVYEKLGFVGKEGRDVFYSTMVHELGHRNHNIKYAEKMENVTLSEKTWQEWKDLIEPYYVKYRKNKEVTFSKEWNRFSYPVNAEDSYSDRSKHHFYNEMWAESHAVLFNTMDDKYEEELAKLNKYFPDIEKFMRNVLK